MLDDLAIQLLIDERVNCRKKRDFARSDEIRQLLQKNKVEISVE